MRLDQRLSLIASLVRPGSRLADIGTDHAHLPIWLVGENVCPRAIATDIRPGPAGVAQRAVEQAGLSARIHVRLGDGLTPVQPGEADDIVIAGMGGETIAAILEQAPWLSQQNCRLVLQPMTKPEVTREYLLTNGFALTSEHVARDGERLYIVMCAAYDPHAAALQQAQPAVYHRGLLDTADEHAAVYLQRQRVQLHKVAEALRGAGNLAQAETVEQLAQAMR